VRSLTERLVGSLGRSLQEQTSDDFQENASENELNGNQVELSTDRKRLGNSMREARCSRQHADANTWAWSTSQGID
jgi:hypothetical protein